jgi:hypothetical protein
MKWKNLLNLYNKTENLHINVKNSRPLIYLIPTTINKLQRHGIKIGLKLAT